MRVRRTLHFLALAFCLTAFARLQAQAGKSSPPPSSGPPPAAGPGHAPNSTLNNGLPSSTGPGSLGYQMPIFLSGRVVFDDGSKPSTDVVIQRVCFGAPHPETHTDSKGRFDFELGRNAEGIMDASVGSSSGADPMYNAPSPMNGNATRQTLNPDGSARFTERQMQNCSIEASFPGYRSDSISLATRRLLDNPDLGVIVLHRLANVQGTTVSVTSELAPPKARKDLDKGMKLAAKGKFPEAERQLNLALELYPKYARAWFELGRIQEAEHTIPAARKSYDAAIAADAKYVSPYDRLAYLAAAQKQWAEAADLSKRALTLNPVEFTSSWFYNAVANFNLRNADEARKSAEQTAKMDTLHRYPQVEHLLAQIYLEAGDPAAAATHLREYLRLAPTAPDAGAMRVELAKLEQSTARAQK